MWRFVEVVVALLFVLGGADAAQAQTRSGAFCNPDPCQGDDYNQAICDEEANECIECDGDGDTYCTQFCLDRAVELVEAGLLSANEVILLGYYCEPEADCDDEHATAHPGGVEVCDGEIDEDCDPTTVAAPHEDADGDGFYPNRCCNGPGRFLTCGQDCDDTNAAIHPDAQRCDGESVQECRGGVWVDASCPPTDVPLRCYEQSNGTGVCAPDHDPS